MADSLLFNFVKYSTMIAPIVIPFIVSMYLTGYNILVSLLFTGFFILAFMIVCVVYVLYNGTHKEEIEKKQVEQFTKLYDTVEKIKEKIE